MNTLSVLCPTRDPGPRVAALLSPLRELADEIVVMANAETAPADLAHYATVADRLLRYEFALPSERAGAWAHAQCRGDWVLVIHGDEVVSPALLRELAELKHARDVVQAWIPRRWVNPDAAHWLDELPWAPDFQLRLVRNDPATLWFVGETHTAAVLAWPARYLDAPLYHLDCLVRPAAERRIKARAYEADRPGVQAPGGGPQNLYYLPEDFARRAPALTPDEDRRAIEAVLGATGQAVAPVDPTTLALATRAQLEAGWEGHPLDPADRRGVLTVLDSDLRFAPGERRALTVRVENHGARAWPGGWERRPLVRLGFRWPSSGAEGPRSPLPCAVPAGEGRVALLTVDAPDRPGRHTLEADLVHEDVAWFGCTTRVEVLVAPRR